MISGKRLRTRVWMICLVLCMAVLPAVVSASDFEIQNGVLVKYNGPGGHVVIPDGATGITGYRLSWEEGAYYRGAFENRTDITGFTLPDSVGYLGDSAFAGCTGLVEVTLPKSLGNIHEKAFQRCTHLTTLYIPGHTYLSSWVARQCI